MPHRDHIANEGQDQSYCECGEMIRHEHLDLPCAMDGHSDFESATDMALRDLDQTWSLLVYEFDGVERDVWHRLDEHIRPEISPRVVRAAARSGGFLRLAERDQWSRLEHEAVAHILAQLVAHAISDVRLKGPLLDALLRNEGDGAPAQRPSSARRSPRGRR